MPPRIRDFVSLVKPNCKATARRWDVILIVNSAAKVRKDILVHEGLNKCLAIGYRIRLSALLPNRACSGGQVGMHRAKTSVCIVQKLMGMHRAETSGQASCKNRWACIVQKQALRLQYV